MKFALRQLVKSPGFSITALLTLALGIGVATTAFTVLNRLLLQSLPFRDADRVVQLSMTSAQSPQLPVTPGDYFDLREQSDVFEKLSLYYVNYGSSFAETGKPAQRAVAMAVTADFLPMIGISPILGRTFTVEDEAHRDSVLILSSRFWKQQFGGDPGVLGRTVRISSETYTIVGVMPPSLDDPMLFQGAVDFWNLDHTSDNRTLREKGWYNGAARLKPGITLKQAQTELDALAARYAHDFPKTNADRGFRVIAFPSQTIGEVGKRLVWLIMALALTVLLIACVNLANLQLVRTTGRTREIAIRLALGSSRSQLVRMLLSESILLSLIGGALGLLIAKWANLYIAQQLSVDMPLDLRVIAFTFITAAITGALFGTMPAWQASKTDVNKGLKLSARGSTSDRSRHRLRQTLIVVELALALTLLAGAGYFVRGIQRMTHRDLGWHADNVVVGIFSLPHDRFGEEKDERSAMFAERFRADLQALPGMDSVVISRGTPAFGLGAGVPFIVDGVPPPPRGKEPLAYVDTVTPGYFAMYGMYITQGRDIAETDRRGGTDVAVVNQALAQKFWPGENPVGKRIGNPDPAKPDWAEIIGVVNDVRGAGNFDDTISPQIYRSFVQNSMRFITFSAHSANDTRTLSDPIRRALARVEPDIAISYMASVPEIMQAQVGGFSLVRRLLVEIASLGLLLAAVGIYGVIANLAQERTQEIGIRMALGAQPTDVRWLFLRNGLRLAAIGTALGLACAFGLMQLLKSLLAIVPGDDPWVVIVVATLLAVVSLLACWLPARRATKVNPLVALRAD